MDDSYLVYSSLACFDRQGNFYVVTDKKHSGKYSLTKIVDCTIAANHAIIGIKPYHMKKDELYLNRNSSEFYPQIDTKRFRHIYVETIDQKNYKIIIK